MYFRDLLTTSLHPALIDGGNRHSSVPLVSLLRDQVRVDCILYRVFLSCKKRGKVAVFAKALVEPFWR